MQKKTLALEGLCLLIPDVFSDERGFFFESYNEERYRAVGITTEFVQDNIAFSVEGTIRALHYQSDPGQAKLVSCISGAIWDVAVDIRPNSPTFGQWVGVELNDQNHHQLFIPVGFAHGYSALTPTTKVQYKVSSLYNPKTECSIRWNDPDLNIAWPVKHPILSARDQQSPFFQDVAGSFR
jgi:dTDP-4-dehydrorhamnose 3,5-epimerase